MFMENEKDILQPLDDSQRRVVTAAGGHHLVLAPPGCGKTHVLTERIRYAHACGVDYADMLCLTFTNRAAREMMGRISQRISDADELRVGSIHRFCSRFLIGEGHVSSDTSIIDDEEAVSIIADFTHEDPENVIGNYQRFPKYQEVIFFSHLMTQVEQHHDIALLMHPAAFTQEDQLAFKRLCQLQHLQHDKTSLIEIYHHADNYKDDAFAPLVSKEMQQAIIHLTLKMCYAHSYTKYKAEHHLLDFEDLLLKTYDIYRNDATCKRYPWVQVDEVQDLNNMQLAIIDELTAPGASVVYLGDEQQAIFSFMGAKVETLEELRQRCKGSIFRLNKNHRSPGYLLNIFNEYAEHSLHINRELLPTTERTEQAPPNALQLVHSATDAEEITDVVRLASRLNEENPQETTAVIVSTNREADNLSEAMADSGVEHFKVSGADLFSTKDMKLLLAHLEVLNNDHSFMAWTRLLTGLRVFPNASLARRFVYKLQQLALSPADLLVDDDRLPAIQEFLLAIEKNILVVYDTETTGLNTQEDDVIEISAMRVQQGKRVGEPLDLYIRTTRPIPERLGDKVNPLYAIYKQKEAAGELLTPQEALSRFMKYVGDCPTLGHNVQFDYHIMDANLHRYLNRSMSELPGQCFDSLRLMRLLVPHLHSYKLERLLEQFSLQGKNSHQAIDDVDATVNLVAFAAEKARQVVARQRDFLSHEKVLPYVRRLRANYKDMYARAHEHLYQRGNDGGCALTQEMRSAYMNLLTEGFIHEISKLDYVVDYVERNLLTDDWHDALLTDQLSRCVMELGTMKEADFCNTKSVRERIYVTTVHKAKGLEFDNVIVYDVTEGRYPGFHSKTMRQQAEDARRLYVAMSRARKRLLFSFPLKSVDRYGRVHDKTLSHFLTPILKMLG